MSQKITKKFFDTKSSKCMVISGITHLVALVFLYIMMMPTGGSEGEDFIDVKFESAISQEQTDDSESNEEYVPDYSDNIKDIAENMDFSDDGSEEADYIKEQYEKIQKQNQESFENNQKINENIEKRSKYGPLLPKHFYGVRIFAQSVIFILDVSGSMDIKEAVLQLKNAYHSLSEYERFSIVIYSKAAWCWQEESIPATEENKKEADAWLQKSIITGGTNMYAGLEKGFEIARTGIDTIYFLTDGQPTEGKIIKTGELLQQVTLWNSEKNIVVNTIGLGSHQSYKFLEDLAAQNGGAYYRK